MGVSSQLLTCATEQSTLLLSNHTIFRLPVLHQWFLFISPGAGWDVPWTSGLAAATIILSFLGSILLCFVLISRRQHKMLLLSLIPQAVVERVRRENGQIRHASISPGTPAETMLKIMSQLLRGLSPSLQDVILVRTALLQSFDLYTPIGMEKQIQDVVTDVSTTSHSSVDARMSQPTWDQLTK